MPCFACGLRAAARISHYKVCLQRGWYKVRNFISLGIISFMTVRRRVNTCKRTPVYFCFFSGAVYNCTQLLQLLHSSVGLLWSEVRTSSFFLLFLFQAALLVHIKSAEHRQGNDAILQPADTPGALSRYQLQLVFNIFWAKNFLLSELTDK